MKPLPWAVRRLRAVVARRALERDMQEEMREHLARATERLVARGMSPADARFAARREFGNVTVHQDDARDIRGARWVDELAADFRFALRYFAHHKRTTATIVIVLALGIGANTAIFSALQAHWVRPAPGVPKDDAHVRIHGRERLARGARWRMRDLTHQELLAIASRRETFAGVAGWTDQDVVLDPGDGLGTRGIAAQFVTPNFFAVLGTPLVAGPGFVQQQDGADMAAVMSFALAAELFDAPATAVGRRILINERPVRVAGIAPPGFRGAIPNRERPALWIPLSARADIARVPARWFGEDAILTVIARLAPAATLDQATAITRQILVRSLPDSATRVGMTRSADVLAMRAPPPLGDSDDIIAFTAIGAIGLLILLVACTNVSSLLVATAVGRRHEVAVRLSLGASRARLLRQLLTETTLLSVGGGVLGLLLYWWFAQWVNSRGLIHNVDLVPDLGTFLFMMAIAIGTGVVFGLSPALHATRAGVAAAMRDSGAGATRRSTLQRAFVVAQIVFTQPLLVLLSVMLSLVAAEYEPFPAAVSERIAVAAFRLPPRPDARIPASQPVDSLVRRIAAHSLVTQVVPEASAFAIRTIHVPRPGTDSGTADSVLYLEGAAPGWFAIQDVPIVLGRDVVLADTAAHDHPIVIGSDLARVLWKDANPIGMTLASPGWRGTDSISMTVVGVYDVTHPTTRGSHVARVYTARGKRWRRDELLIRTRGRAESVMPELRSLLRDAAPTLPVRLATLAQLDAEKRGEVFRIAAASGVAGALALLLASLGLYGVVSLAVRQRTREIGIRIAVGANPSRVARMFLASGVRVGAVAMLIGLPLSIAGLRILLSQRIVIAPQVNVWVIGLGIGVILLLVASVATWLPARQAARVDPATTLRVE